MDNIETFNTIVGLIFADLYEMFPVPKKLLAADYAERVGLLDDESVPRLERPDPAAAAIEWLIQEGLIRQRHESGIESIPGLAGGYGVSPCTLTHKGLQLLSVPTSLKEHDSIGSQMVKAAKDGTLTGMKELAKTAVVEGSKLAFQAGILALLKP